MNHLKIRKTLKIALFLTVQFLDLREKSYLSLDPDPWIRIFLRIRDPGSQTVANPTDPESKALV